MTPFIYLALLLVIGVASPGPAAVSPQTLFDAGLRRQLPPPCRELTDAERRERHVDPQGKAATYSMTGEYLCETAIFRRGERDGYSDFLLRQAGPRALVAARQAVRLSATEPRLLGAQWSVVVTGGPLVLQQQLRQIYLQAFAEALGAGQVRHSAALPLTLDLAGLPVQDRALGGSKYVGTVQVSVTPRAVQATDILFDVVARGGGGTWRL